MRRGLIGRLGVYASVIAVNFILGYNQAKYKYEKRLEILERSRTNCISHPESYNSLPHTLDIEVIQNDMQNLLYDQTVKADITIKGYPYRIEFDKTNKKGILKRTLND